MKTANDQSQFSSVQSLSHLQLFAIAWTAACQASLSITNFWSVLKLMSIESVMPSNHLILCHPLLLPHSIFPSIRVFSKESVLPIRWPKYCSFNISPSNEYLGLISFRIDWFDLLAVQGTGDIKGTLHAKMGTIKERNGTDLTEAEDTKKRWQEYRGTIQKRLQRPR